eukprot:CAMPEP_0182816328 /NCGR_PEP_ID=MMETSP0006_2-20121128/10876_1 /TAXON_ID=97485 /ORGANISM="Prymnesium parvum, Strain Texoma1" /LENGTH=188 /DNA_ID=CAMNT_0024942607 /DNA_START=555 /DNA_END=1125 /DNA_ORIENTATION=-
MGAVPKPTPVATAIEVSVYCDVGGDGGAGGGEGERGAMQQLASYQQNLVHEQLSEASFLHPLSWGTRRRKRACVRKSTGTEVAMVMAAAALAAGAAVQVARAGAKAGEVQYSISRHTSRTWCMSNERGIGLAPIVVGARANKSGLWSHEKGYGGGDGDGGGGDGGSGGGEGGEGGGEGGRGAIQQFGS